MSIKITSRFIIADGRRTGIWISTGPWVEGVNPETIKLRPKRGAFPRHVREAVAVENESDSREDYFAPDCIRLVPGDVLYEQARAASEGAGQ